MLALSIIYILVLFMVSVLSGWFSADSEDWLLFAVIWPFIVAWLILQIIALLGYELGETLTGKKHK